jgi:hypothetical protein
LVRSLNSNFLFELGTPNSKLFPFSNNDSSNFLWPSVDRSIVVSAS